MLARQPNPYRELERMLGYRFKRRYWIEKALTHRSYRFEGDGIEFDNQRLEFLGDAVLDLLLAGALFRRHPGEDEGRLTMRRSELTSGKALAKIGADVGLGRFLSMWRGEEQSGGRDRASNLADALEAVFGAAYMDGGMRAAERVFEALFSVLLDEGADRGGGWTNPKGALQEWCQREWKAGPVYDVIAREGPAHAAVFRSRVQLGDHVYGEGCGCSRRASEMEAARDALRRLTATAAEGSRSCEAAREGQGEQPGARKD